MNIQELRKKAEAAWEGCHHCDENDKYMWINGYITGVLANEIDNINNQTENKQGKIADPLINRTSPSPTKDYFKCIRG